MHVTLVYVEVTPDHVQDFIEATRPNHESSVKEPGNLRFDVLQSADDPTRFILYEAHATAEDAAGHKQTEHYLRWREAVGPWMATPRKGVLFDGLFPEVGAPS